MLTINKVYFFLRVIVHHIEHNSRINVIVCLYMQKYHRNEKLEKPTRYVRTFQVSG